jgi:hypothetical protein
MVELFVIVERGAKVVSDGPRDVMVTKPAVAAALPNEFVIRFIFKPFAM